MCLSGNVGTAVLGMDPESALIHGDVVSSLLAPCHDEEGTGYSPKCDLFVSGS